ncbi:aminoglycoside phosphotransferase family protein [Kitasatospora sp. NPDC004799]|uniref:phosphotransferase family protein n=1 Tax=Kitasatospora sp. NPDC004799 TaxID=3154460 RepID=UPI00339F190D
MPSSTLTPKPPAGSTALRPGWLQLPAPVRSLIERRLGGRVTAGPSAGDGFTPGFAAVLHGPKGPQFVKAANGASDPVIADCYRREALINRALPAAVPAPRLRWLEEDDGWVVLGLDAVAGARTPADPWRPAELAAVLDTCTAIARELERPTGALLDVGLRPVAEESTDAWRDLASGGGDWADRLPGWFPRGLVDPLAELESGWAAATAGHSVLHWDLRRDNVLFDGRGKAWVCDWNWPCLGASWLDLTVLLAAAHADGHDASRLFADHPTARGVAPEQLDTALAALAGLFLRSGTQPPKPDSPELRGHQTWCGEVVLNWLSERRGWA